MDEYGSKLGTFKQMQVSEYVPSHMKKNCKHDGLTQSNLLQLCLFVDQTFLVASWESSEMEQSPQLQDILNLYLKKWKECP
jgi:hypothetical protein